MVHNFASSPSKAPDSPFCGDDVLPVDQTVDPKKDPGKYRFLQPSPIEDGGKNYYEYDAESISKKRFFKSYYERIVGGSTWHWQGIYIRMLPNDFNDFANRTHALFGGAVRGFVLGGAASGIGGSAIGVFGYGICGDPSQ